jgi:hypothetical protein
MGERVIGAAWLKGTGSLFISPCAVKKANVIVPRGKIADVSRPLLQLEYGRTRVRMRWARTALLALLVSAGIALMPAGVRWAKAERNRMRLARAHRQWVEQCAVYALPAETVVFDESLEHWPVERIATNAAGSEAKHEYRSRRDGAAFGTFDRQKSWLMWGSRPACLWHADRMRALASNRVRCMPGLRQGPVVQGTPLVSRWDQPRTTRRNAKEQDGSETLIWVVIMQVRYSLRADNPPPFEWTVAAEIDQDGDFNPGQL